MAHPGTRLEMVVSTPSVAQLDEQLLTLWEDNRPMPEGVRHTPNQALQPVLGHYDYILIDCPPGLSLFSSAALLASHYFITPVIPEPLSLLGVNLVQDRARELKGRTVEFKGVILNIVKHYRRTHQRISGKLYGREASKYQPFQYWLPDNETIRKLGEFDPDEEGQWALGVDQKFTSLHAKYSLTYQLANPASGPLSRTDEEGPRYRLDERIERLTEEFEERCGTPPRKVPS
jgi:MinD-like ATPase involved in chromosome partitioning or flagellar assembly